VKLLFVMSPEPDGSSAAAVSRYIAVGRRLGHEVAVYGEPRPGLPALAWSREAGSFDHVLFVVQVSADLPDPARLMRLLNTVPRERRVVIDLWGRYNDTIRVEHDFNHLEKVDRRLGWEWIEDFQKLSDRVLQPALTPLRPDVRRFLFFGFDQAAVARPGPAEWGTDKRYGAVYVGHNWMRWTQLRSLLESLEPLLPRLGRVCLVGWGWDERPEWASQNGIAGVDVDRSLLTRLQVETRGAVPSSAVIDLLGHGLVRPVIHRPLFRQLGLVTNRTFETFCADTIPLLLLPPDFVAAVYGLAALALVPGADLAAFVQGLLAQPQPYWEAVLATRAHLARHHSYEQRFQELAAILAGPANGGSS